MADVMEKAAVAVDFLDGLLERLELVQARVEKLESSGELTPELEAEMMSRLSGLWSVLPAVRESVDPTLAPLLRLRRLAKRKGEKLLAGGSAPDEIRSAFAGLVDRLGWTLPEAKREHVGPTIEAALEEVLSVPGGGQDARRSPGLGWPSRDSDGGG